MRLAFLLSRLFNYFGGSTKEKESVALLSSGFLATILFRLAFIRTMGAQELSLFISTFLLSSCVFCRFWFDVCCFQVVFTVCLHVLGFLEDKTDHLRH